MNAYEPFRNHFECFWQRAKKGMTEGSIRHFENLKWDDQEKIRARIQMIEGTYA